MNREVIAKFMKYFTPINIITVTRDNYHIDQVGLSVTPITNVLTHCIGDFNHLVLYPKMNFISSVSNTTEGYKYVIITNIDRSLNLLINVLQNIMSDKRMMEDNYFVVLNDNVKRFIEILEREGDINEYNGN